LIAVKWTFDVNELSTKNQSLVEHECARIKCDKFFLYNSAVYLAQDFRKRAYDLFVEDIEAFTDNRESENQPKSRWKVDEKYDSVLPLNETTDLESDFISGLIGCDLDQVNVVPDDNGTSWTWCLRMLLSTVKVGK
jgi:hypothetical protein